MKVIYFYAFILFINAIHSIPIDTRKENHQLYISDKTDDINRKIGENIYLGNHPEVFKNKKFLKRESIS